VNFFTTFTFRSSFLLTNHPCNHDSFPIFQEFHFKKVDPENEKAGTSTDVDRPNLTSISNTSTMKDGEEFRIVGELKNPQEIVKRSGDFESVIVVLQELKCDEDFQPEYVISEQQRVKIAQHEAEVTELRAKMAQLTEENARKLLAEECCHLLKDIGPPWDWLYNFASTTCREKTYNFLESETTNMNDMPSSDDSFDYLNDRFISVASTSVTTADDTKSSASGGSFFSIYDTENGPSNNHKVLIDTICSISEASDKGECKIRETTSLASFLDEQHSKRHLETSDYERLKMFIDRAMERGLVFNDLNELYNYFIQESARERYTHEVEIREEDEDETELENVIVPTRSGVSTEIQAEKSEKAAESSKNVVSIFGESGIEVDGKLLDAKVSERMILGLVDKPQFEDNVSDVASSISSLSQAETVKLKQNVTREKDTQTTTYKEQIQMKRIQSKHAGKSKSASSIKRQPFVCKIPPLPGIGPSLDGEKLESILRFITHRSFQQGGFVYPRNFLEDECPSMTG
jgi:hypothetical protein